MDYLALVALVVLGQLVVRVAPMHQAQMDYVVQGLPLLLPVQEAVLHPLAHLVLD